MWTTDDLAEDIHGRSEERWINMKMINEGS